MLRGETPYDYNFYNPPWALLPLVPFALLPEPYGAGMLLFVSASALGYTCYRLGAERVAFLLVFLSPPVLESLLCGQLEWLVLLGAVVGPMWGIPLLLIKPQVGGIFALYWAYIYCRVRKTRRAFEMLLPTILLLAISFLLYGLWPLQTAGLVQREIAHPWPYLIPVGFGFVYMMLQRRTIVGSYRYALLAAPCLSPHTWMYAWSGVVVSLVHDPKLLAAVVGGMWIVKYLQIVGVP